MLVGSLWQNCLGSFLLLIVTCHIVLLSASISLGTAQPGVPLPCLLPSTDMFYQPCNWSLCPGFPCPWGKPVYSSAADMERVGRRGVTATESGRARGVGGATWLRLAARMYVLQLAACSAASTAAACAILRPADVPSSHASRVSRAVAMACNESNESR
jgi:hypothetical protein